GLTTCRSLNAGMPTTRSQTLGAPGARGPRNTMFSFVCPARRDSSMWAKPTWAVGPRRKRTSRSRILLVLHRCPYPRHRLGRGVGHLLDQGGDLLAGQRVDLDLGFVGVGQERRVLDRQVEGAAQ